MEEPVSIADAAHALGVTEARLRRLLARPEWQGRTTRAMMATRTGERERTVLPVSLLDELAIVIRPLDEQEPRERTRRGRKAEHLQTLTGTVPNGSEHLRTPSNDNTYERFQTVTPPEETFTNVNDNVYEHFQTSPNAHGNGSTREQETGPTAGEVAELRARLADTQAERDRLAALLEREGERLTLALEALRQAQDETRAVRAISARASVGLIEPQGAQNGPIQGDSVPEAPMEPPTAKEAQNGQKRGFWRRLVDSFSGGG